ncbi:MAG: adenylate/guanylate cyclase domain-containing protein, partial [Lewinella sp.]|nr:adenylate/guanylate cyclase domain-containing protein [Lewinella sp.]
MKHFGLLVAALLWAVVGFAQTEEIEDIKAALAEAETPRERMLLNYELGEAYMRVDAEQAETYSKQAFNAAVDQGNNPMAARAAFQVALAYERQRDDRNTEVWLRTTLNYAKQAGDSDLIIRSVEKRSRLATKDRNYRRAYEIVEEAFTYFSQNGTSISDLEARYESLRAQIERERRELERERDALEFQVRNLRLETDNLQQDRGRLEQQTEQLSQANREKEEMLSMTEEELAAAEERAQQRAAEVNELSEEAAKQKLLLSERDKELVERENDLMAARIRAQEQELIVYTAAGAAGILLLLALLLYSRFRAKRRAAKTLQDKNHEIEEARQQSDELLLNILPEPIAEELKASGKAKARQFEEVTVLFSDFKNFTLIAEQLSPDELVQELDKCFKAFDFIIGQYPDIEKIKTIGDAYMCASGLTDRKTLPNNLVKAALEMQAFLEEQKQERMRIGKPYFEARIGIHTGSVVAGVVGVKKFAYDIWGDTVNIAS